MSFLSFFVFLLEAGQAMWGFWAVKSLPIYEDEEDPITGEVTQKLKGYLTKKLSWERTALTNLKSKLDRAHYRSLTPHAKALAKPRFEGDISKRPAPDGPSWAVRQAIAQ